MLKALDAKLSGPRLKMPSLDISAPKVTAPDIDLHLKTPKLEFLVPN